MFDSRGVDDAEELSGGLQVLDLVRI